MSKYSHLTDAELRAQISMNPYGTEPLVEEVMRRFCDTGSLTTMRKSLERAESLLALIEHYSAEANSCLDEIKDALQRTTE